MLDGFEWSLYQYEGKVVKAKLSLLSSVSVAVKESVHVWVVPLETGSSQKIDKIPLTETVYKIFERCPFDGEESQSFEDFFVGAEYARSSSPHDLYRLERVYRDAETNSLFVEVKDLQESDHAAPYSTEISKFFDYFNQ